MIVGKNVRLRAISKKDLPDFATWINDPEVHRNLVINFPMSLEQEEKWYEEILTHPVEEHPLSIEVLDHKEWKLAGDVAFMNLDQRSRCAEIGIFIGDKNFHNRGFGTETMKLMVKHGFLDLNLNRIYLRVFETNPRGIRCYEKAGFKHEGRLRQGHFLEGHYIDILMMSILRDEWKKKDMKEGSS